MRSSRPADSAYQRLTAVRAIEQYMLRVPPKALFPDANWRFLVPVRWKRA